MLIGLMQESDLDDTNVFPLFGLDSDQQKKTISALNGCWKAQSIVYLEQLGLPTLQAAAITKWNQKTKSQLEKFLKEKNWKSVVIRTDKAKETGKDIPRGGYLVQIEQLEEEIKKIIDSGRIVMILEPRDRFRNLYGINILYENSSPDTLYLEIVGPGFEVSNINRGDITPHERMTIKRVSDEPKITSHEIISSQDYKNTVYSRLLQIGRSIDRGNRYEGMSNEKLLDNAKTFLKKNNYNYLLNELEYPCIPIIYIKKIKDLVAKLPHKMTKLSLEDEKFVISATIFESGELVFWDIVFPKRKYEGLQHGQ